MPVSNGCRSALADWWLVCLIGDCGLLLVKQRLLLVKDSDGNGVHAVCDDMDTIITKQLRVGT